MVEIARWEFEGQSDRLFIHFDVQEHFLKLDTFIRTANSARGVIEALDKTFFQGSLEYELIVLPPESGTFLSKIALWISGGAATVFAFANTEIGSAYIEGLNGKSPSHWANQLGEKTQSLLLDASELIEDDLIPKVNVSPKHGVQPISPADEAVCLASAKIIIAMTRGVLEKSTEQLNIIGMEVGNLTDALEARADFFSACIDDRTVRRIGFTSEEDFPSRETLSQNARKGQPGKRRK